MVNEAIILAGGLGTRLKNVISDIPKPMAPINGRPFLELVLDQCIENNISTVVLAVGYKYESIKDYFSDSYKNITLKYSIEENPLGTGGAILKACRQINQKYFFVINGDTFFDLNFSNLSDHFFSLNADISLALCEMENFDRYGTVILDKNDNIIKFEEKKPQKKGLINAGIYLTSSDIFNNIYQDKFSFEKDILEKHISTIKMTGYCTNNFFIDIGIPEDYQKAQNQL